MISYLYLDKFNQIALIVQTQLINSIFCPTTQPIVCRQIENLLCQVHEEMLGRGAARHRQILPQDVLPVHHVPQVAGRRRLL